MVVVVKTGVAETEASLHMLLEQDVMVITLTFDFVFVSKTLGSIESMTVETLVYICVECILELVKLDCSGLVVSVVFVDDTIHVRFLKSVALSKTELFADATNSCVK